MTDQERERILIECLEKWHRRRTLGENPRPEDLREIAGAAWEDFLAVLDVEARLDAAIEPRATAAFPRPFGAYTLLSELGRGAMGVVYRALHVPLGRHVALKVLRSGLDTDPVARERFRREARACAQVRHAALVEIHDVGEVEDQPYYSMTLLSGRSLADLIRAGEAPPPRELFRRMAEVADALNALHEAGILHRDVKPSNVIVAPDGRMVLADLGLARTVASDRLTATGQQLGTPLYMSPEQVLGDAREIDGRADVYGLGATLYEALAGRTLFPSMERGAVMRRILKERPATLASVAPSIDRECGRVVMKAVEKRKEDRYRSAAALRDDLRAYAEGREVVGRPVPGTVLWLRDARRHWPAAAAVLAAAGGLWYWAAHRPATLLVQTFPSGEVLVDGTARGNSPVRLTLPPGVHEMRLRLPGFEERVERIELSPGDTRDVRQVLVASDMDDPAVFRRLVAGLDLVWSEFDRPPASRVDAAPLALPVFPRGEVRADDLATYQIEMGEEFARRDPKGDRLRFARGAEVLHEEPFEPRNLVTEAPIPDVVRRALRAGDRVSWGWAPANGPPLLAEFVVSARDVSERIEEIEERLAEQPAAARALVKSHALLGMGYPLAAYREAAAAAGLRPKSAAAWSAMLESLARLSLEKSRLWLAAERGRKQAPEPPRDR